MSRGKKADTLKADATGERWRNAAEAYFQPVPTMYTYTYKNYSAAKASKAQAATEATRQSNAAAELGNDQRGIRLLGSQFARHFLFGYVRYPYLAKVMITSTWTAVTDLDVGSFIFLIISAALQDLGIMLGGDCYSVPESSLVLLSPEIMAILDKSFVTFWSDKPLDPSDSTYTNTYKAYLVFIGQALTDYVAGLPPGKLSSEEVELFKTASDRLLAQLLDATRPSPLPVFCGALVEGLVKQLKPLGPVFDYFAHILDPVYCAYGPKSGAKHPRKLHDPSESFIRVISEAAIVFLYDRIFLVKLLSLVQSQFTPLIPIFDLKECHNIIQATPPEVPRGFDTAMQKSFAQHCKAGPTWMDQTSTDPTLNLIANGFGWAFYNQAHRTEFRPSEWGAGHGASSVTREITRFSKGIKTVVYERRKLHEFIVTFHESIRAREALVAFPSQLFKGNRQLHFLDFVLPPPVENRRDVKQAVADEAPSPPTHWDILEGYLEKVGPHISDMAEEFDQDDMKYSLLRSWQEFVKNARDYWKADVRGDDTEGDESPYHSNYYLQHKHKTWMKFMDERLTKLFAASAGGEPGSPMPDDMLDEQAVEDLITLAAPLQHLAQALSPPSLSPAPTASSSLLSSPNTQMESRPLCHKVEESPSGVHVGSYSVECKTEVLDPQDLSSLIKVDVNCQTTIQGSSEKKPPGVKRTLPPNEVNLPPKRKKTSHV